MNPLLEDRLLPIVMFASVVTVMAVHDWLIALSLYRPLPWLTSGLAVFSIGYGTYRYFDFKRTVERLRLARDGERIVGQFLETLRAD